jgi:hypothetical protein
MIGGAETVGARGGGGGGGARERIKREEQHQDGKGRRRAVQPQVREEKVGKRWSKRMKVRKRISAKGHHSKK